MLLLWSPRMFHDHARIICSQFAADAGSDDNDFASKRPKQVAASKTMPKAKAASKARDPPTGKKGTSASSAGAPRASPAKRGKASASATSSSSGASAVAASSGVSSAGGKKSAPPPKAIKEKDAPGVVLEYMNAQNRPYSLINVFDNLHGAVKRAALSRVLDALADAGQLKSKVYGKAKIYWPDQAQYGDITDEMVASLQAKAAELTSAAQSVGLERRAIEGTVARLKSMTSTPDLEKRVKEQEAVVAALRERLSVCEAAAEAREAGEASGCAASATAAAAARRPAIVRGKGKTELQAILGKYVKAWKQRKRMVMDLAGQIEEGANMSRKKVLDKAGVETDEEAGGPSLRDLE